MSSLFVSHALSNTFTEVPWNYSRPSFIAGSLTIRVLNTGISIPLGIFIGLTASFVQSFGLAIQRRSHVANSQLPEPERKAEYRRPLWLVGFVVFITSNVLGSLVQIASLPVVILAPLGAVSLLWNALFARLLLRPPLILGTALIGGGAALIAVYGVVPETTRSLDELVALFARPAFLAWFCVEGAIVVVCLVATHMVEYSWVRRLEAAPLGLQSNGELTQSSFSTPPEELPVLSPLSISAVLEPCDHNEERSIACQAHERTPLLDLKQSDARSPYSETGLRKYGSSSARSSTLTIHAPSVAVDSRTPFFVALAYAATSGIMSGLCLIFAKSGVQLLLLTLGGSNQFYRWEAWALVGGLVVFAVGQLWYLNQGLRLADPAFVCPSAFCFYNFSSILNGLVYFDQFRQLPGLHIGLVVLGMVILLGGVWSFSTEAGVEHVWSDPLEGTDEDVTPPESVLARRSSIEGAAVGQASTGGSVPHREEMPRASWRGETRPIAVPMERNAYSEGALGQQEAAGVMSVAYEPRPVDSSMRRPVSCGASDRKTAMRSYTEQLASSTGAGPSRRRSTTVVEPHRMGSSILSCSTSGGGGAVVSPAGLTIGLSPTSPGFGVGVPQWRARRATGLGLGTGGGRGEASGRRAVSEGAELVWGRRGDEGTAEPNGGEERRLRGWRWLRRVVGLAARRRANEEVIGRGDPHGDRPC